MNRYNDEGHELITEFYVEQNRLLHNQVPTYGTSGWQYKDAVLELCDRYCIYDVLDYGAGKGTLAKAMPWPIKQYDPAIAGIDSCPDGAAIVVCGDVLEHIEEDCLTAVICHILHCTERAAYFVIGTRPASKNLPDGRNAHLIQKPAWWWANYLGRCGFTTISASTGRKNEAIFTAVPA